jgi:GT2 family glycosyltransferase
MAREVTILVVTHDRPDRLRALLRSIQAAGSDDVGRVVIVDDSSEVPEYASEFSPLPVTVLRPPARLFISHAKNLGLRSCRSEFVFLIDDDNLVDRDVLDHPLAVARADPRIAAVMPSVVYHRRPELVWVYATPFAPGRWGFSLVGRNRPREPTWEGRLLETDALPNAALLRRSAIEAVGGFDPALPINSSADLCQRLKGAGWRAWADTTVRIRHDVELPGERGFWAAHSLDEPRLYYEAHDWFVLQRRLHPEITAFTPRALRHAFGWIAPKELAFLLRREARTVPLSMTVVRGCIAGLRDAAHEGARPTGYPRTSVG